MRMNICYMGEIEKNYTAEREAQLLNEGDVIQQAGAHFGYSPTRQMAQRKCVSDVKRLKRGNGYDGDFVLLILGRNNAGFSGGQPVQSISDTGGSLDRHDQTANALTLAPQETACQLSR